MISWVVGLISGLWEEVEMGLCDIYTDAIFISKSVYCLLFYFLAETKTSVEIHVPLLFVSLQPPGFFFFKTTWTQIWKRN